MQLLVSWIIDHPDAVSEEEVKGHVLIELGRLNDLVPSVFHY